MFYNNMDIIINNGLCIYLECHQRDCFTDITITKKASLVDNLRGIELEKYVENITKREAVYSKHTSSQMRKPNLILSLEQQIKRYFGTIK